MKIVIGGAVEKNAIAEWIKNNCVDEVEFKIMTDIQAAMAIKNGDADYYVGACHTGGGGALSMAIAILTMAKCETLSMPSIPPKLEKVKEAIKKGKIAFGFTASHYEQALEMIFSELEVLKK